MNDVDANNDLEHLLPKETSSALYREEPQKANLSNPNVLFYFLHSLINFSQIEENDSS